MGQKTHPLGFRLGYIKTWSSRWFARKDYTRLLHEDLAIKDYIRREFAGAALSRVEVERTSNRTVVHIYTARPGMIIGTKGTRISELREELKAIVGSDLEVEIHEIENPELDAQLVAESIAGQLERRMGFRRVMKKTIQTVMKLGAKGCRIQIKGRIGGAEMKRKERYAEGRVPLHTLRADIDYGQAEAHTVYGIVGVKVWIFRDEVLPSDIEAAAAIPEPTRRPVKRKRRRVKRPGRAGAAAAAAEGTAPPSQPETSAAEAPN